MSQLEFKNILYSLQSKISVPTDINVSSKFPTELKNIFFIPGEFWKATGSVGPVPLLPTEIIIFDPRIPTLVIL